MNDFCAITARYFIHLKMHRNPGASIDFSSGDGLIRDVGRDGGGIYRNISRDLRVPDFLTKGSHVSLSWAQVCKCLPAQNLHDQVKANIIDSVVLSDGEVKLYLYTTREGYIAQKPRNMLDLRRIRDQFLNYVPVLQPDKHLYVAVTAMEGEEPQFVTNDALGSLCLGATPKSLELIQCFMPSKGDPHCNKTYRTDYWLDRTAQIIMRTERVGIDSLLSGSGHVTSRANMNSKLNAMMETWTQKVANRVQAVYSCRVVRMTLEFVQDLEGKVWLVRSAECSISTEEVSTRDTRSSEQMKRVRTGTIVSGSRSPERGRVNSSEGGDRRVASSPVSRPSSIGRHSDARVSRRHRREEDTSPSRPHDAAFLDDSSMSGSFFGGNYQLDGVSSHSFPDIGGVVGGRQRSRASDDGLADLAFEVPNSRLGKEVPMTDAATAVFGSTQLKGCQGDFCHIRVDLLEDASVAGGRQTNHSLSKFRRRLMEADTSHYGSVEDSSFGSTYEELDNAAATNIILGDVAGGDTSDNSTFSRRQCKKKSGDSPAADESSAASHLIPFRSIIQARQEMPHVKALLLRRKNKESGDYMSVDDYHDLAVSGKLPAVYYTEVPCCKNCAQVCNACY